MKKTLLSLITVGCVSLSSLSLAGPIPDYIPITASISNLAKAMKVNFQNLNAEIQALTLAQERSYSNMMYESGDPFFPNYSASSSDAMDPALLTNSMTSQLTGANIKTALEQVPTQIANSMALMNVTNQLLTGDKNPYTAMQQELSIGTPASDTLYLSNNVCSSSDCANFPASKPAKTNDQDFDFSSFIGPASYNTPDKLAAAQHYLQYLLETYKPLTESTSQGASMGQQPKTVFQLINDKISNLKAAQKKDDSAESPAQWLQDNVIDNPEYQKYQLAVRSMMAAKTLSLSNFNFLMAERIPQKNLGTEAGLPTKDASPLEVENYDVNKVVNDPKFYKSMKSASPVVIQREQLAMLATLVKEVHRNAEINERNLATLTLLVTQGNTGSAAMLDMIKRNMKNSIFPQNNQKQAASQAANMQQK